MEKLQKSRELLVIISMILAAASFIAVLELNISAGMVEGILFFSLIALAAVNWSLGSWMRKEEVEGEIAVDGEGNRISETGAAEKETEKLEGEASIPETEAHEEHSAEPSEGSGGRSIDVSNAVLESAPQSAEYSIEKMEDSKAEIPRSSKDEQKHKTQEKKRARTQLKKPIRRKHRAAKVQKKAYASH